MKRRSAIGRIAASGIAVTAGGLGGCAVAPGVRQSSESEITTRFSTAHQLSHPFVCAGMAFVCDTPELAIAVGRAGAAGCLAGTLLSPTTLADRIQTIQSNTDGFFHVNLLTPFPHESHIDVCIAQQVPAVSFHWGHPDPATVNKLSEANIAVWVQVGNAIDAQQAVGYGASCIVAQGSEAGGHNYGQLPLSMLLAEIRLAVGDGPMVLGAGGIADGRTAAAALLAGADGVWVGTRMVATSQANAHPEYQRRLVAAGGSDTVLTGVYGPENPKFNPIRVVRNDTVDRWQHRLKDIPADRSAMTSIGRTRFGEGMIDIKPFDSFGPVPETTGPFDQMPIMAGQGVGLIQSVEPAGQVIQSMMAQAARQIDALVS
ncbi:MAG: NAD(P)H-dependent flavin oxidoreductase [Lysobacterales bacterium]